jgi:PAS domain S-box-containing protein
VFVADDEGRYVAVNRHAGETLGYTRRDLLGMTVPEVAVAPQGARAIRINARKRPSRSTTPIRCSDGRILTLRFWAKAVEIGGLDFWISVGVTPRRSGAAVV